jgi:hypothetical protein
MISVCQNAASYSDKEHQPLTFSFQEYKREIVLIKTIQQNTDRRFISLFITYLTWTWQCINYQDDTSSDGTISEQ